MDIWKSIVPEAVAFLEYQRNSREGSVAGAECARGKCRSEVRRRVIDIIHIALLAMGRTLSSCECEQKPLKTEYRRLSCD